MTPASMHRLESLLAVLAILGAGCSTQPSVTATPEPSVTPIASASTTTASAQASPTPATSGPFTDLRWDRDQAVFADGWLYDVVGVGPGFVAVGEAGARENPSARVWSSPDGHVWSATTLDAAPSSASAVAAGVHGLVAIGAAGGKAAIWTSTDGIAWARAAALPDSGGQLSDVAAGGPGYVAGGRSSSGHPAIWLSSDGRKWSQFVPNPELAGTVTAIQQAGATIYAVVTDTPTGIHQETYNEPRRVWTSADGRHWTPVPDGSLPPLATVATATVGDQIMILGLIVSLDGSASSDGWNTDDGVSWYRAFTTSPVNGGATTATSVNGKLVLAGELVATACCTVPALWAIVGSAGFGHTAIPQAVAFKGDPPGEFQIMSVAALGTTIVAVGGLEFVTAGCTGCVREGVVVAATLSP